MHVHEPELLVYLSGEVHSDWRTELQSLAEDREVRLRFAAPITDHPASDAWGGAHSRAADASPPGAHATPLPAWTVAPPPGGFGGGEGWTAEPVAVAVMAIFWPASQCRDHAHRK